MSIAFDPSETCPVWLAADHHLPEAERPTFLARYLTGRETRKVRQMIKDAVAIQKDPEKFWALVDRILAFQLVGWRNVVDRAGAPIAFKIEADTEGCPVLASAQDALTDEERFDLVIGCRDALGLSEVDKKKSSVRSGFPAVIFAGSAGPAARSRPDRTMPSTSPASDAKEQMIPVHFAGEPESKPA